MLFSNTSNFLFKTARTKWLHWHAFHQVLVVTKFKFNSCRITKDFEKVMTNIAKDQFADSEKDRYKFHSKYVWQQKMKKIGIRNEQVSNVIANNCLDTLAIVLQNKI